MKREYEAAAEQLRSCLRYLKEAARLRPGATVVLGCSTSEVAGGHIGHDSVFLGTAAEYLAQVTPEEFRRILTDYGEEKWAARIAQIFAEKRAQKPIETTADLVAVVDAAIPKAVRRKDDGHPARRTFQAVRIAVNDELAPLEKALRDFVELLAPGGRLLVITFHSLEDRIVKNTFRAMQHPCTCPPKAPICTCGKVPLGKVLGGGGVKPSNHEVQENVRARSAKLRIFEKNGEEGE